MKRGALYALTLVSVVVFFAVLAGFVFGISGTAEYAEGWGFLLAFALPTLFITLYFLVKDPKLIERRVVPGESRPRQMVGQSLAGLVFFVGLIGVPALDYRFSWSSVPLALSAAGDVLVVAGFVIVFFVFRSNSFTSKSIEIMSGQKVVSTGPYAVARHPMYTGAMLIIAGTPLALGSWYGLVASAILWVIIIFRLLDEEKMLKAGLEGYEEYCKTTKYRLFPYIW